MIHTPGILPLFGRILVGVIFVMSGLNKIMNPAMTEQYMASHGMPMTKLFLLGAIAIELGAGLALMAGFMTRAAAWALFLFMIPTTLIFHTNFGDQNQMIHFLKNVSMMGGLLYVASYGAGLLSVDAKTSGLATTVHQHPEELLRKSA
jgi:putative oxidoreductase